MCPLVQLTLISDEVKKERLVLKEMNKKNTITWLIVAVKSQLITITFDKKSIGPICPSVSQEPIHYIIDTQKISIRNSPILEDNNKTTLKRNWLFLQLKKSLHRHRWFCKYTNKKNPNNYIWREPVLDNTKIYYTLK